MGSSLCKDYCNSALLPWKGSDNLYIVLLLHTFVLFSCLYEKKNEKRKKKVRTLKTRKRHPSVFFLLTGGLVIKVEPNCEQAKHWVFTHWIYSISPYGSWRCKCEASFLLGKLCASHTCAEQRGFLLESEVCQMFGRGEAATMRGPSRD